MNKTTKARPVLAFEDRQNIDSIKCIVTQDLHGALSAMVGAFHALGVGSLDISELKSLAEDPETVVRDKVASTIEAPIVAGFRMKKESIINQLELPDISELKAAAARVIKIGGNRLSLFLTMYELEGKEVRVKEATLETYLDGSRTYAITPEEIEVLEKYNAFLQAYNDFDALLKTKSRTAGGLNAFPAQVLLYKDSVGRGVINPAIYSAIMNPGTGSLHFNRNAVA
ncbi:hypothetical protein SAMN05444008_11285 [Cnuella takakiae]|uniref:Uncharacterized protein n=1 Tax=Cnuella takakiae TaxID=1302690 RepID=A0A1M5EKS0_9BACT|nr:hypothetical protein [Cnuella takakiae]OLY91211.1 hypothetical protein BUE76_04325 [Cnuella takakiae]SHF79776.1 hypothetical protein SAMN05444008_11285 [Cnuella takakiae]